MSYSSVMSRSIKPTVAVLPGGPELEISRRFFPLRLIVAVVVLDVPRVLLPRFPARRKSSSVREPAWVSSFCWLILSRRGADNMPSLDLGARNFDSGISSESSVESSSFVSRAKGRLSGIAYI